MQAAQGVQRSSNAARRNGRKTRFPQQQVSAELNKRVHHKAAKAKGNETSLPLQQMIANTTFAPCRIYPAKTFAMDWHA